MDPEIKEVEPKKSVVKCDLNKKFSMIDLEDNNIQIIENEENINVDIKLNQIIKKESISNFKFEQREKALLEKIKNLQFELEIERQKCIENQNISIRRTIYKDNSEIMLEKESYNTIYDFFNKLQEIINNDQISQLVQEYKNRINTEPVDYNEVLEMERRVWESEKNLILKKMDEKCQRLFQVEIDNEYLLETNKNYESNFNPNDGLYVGKILSLERNLKQLNEMHQDALTQKSTLSIQLKVFDSFIRLLRIKLERRMRGYWY
jgi:hypothetical protein